MSNCGNNKCQWHKYCESGLMWYDEDITECRHWIKPKPTKMKSIKVAESDYDKAVKVLKRNKIEFNDTLKEIFHVNFRRHKNVKR